MEYELKIHNLPTGALLLDAPQEAILIGGGLPVEQLEQMLEPYLGKLSLIVMPHEHSNRRRGLFALAAKWDVPLAGYLPVILRDHRVYDPPRIPPCMFLAFNGETLRYGEFDITPFPVKYDSLYPFGLRVTVGGTMLGIVQDGRLTAESLNALRSCDFLVLTNCRETDESDTSVLAKRIRYVYPSQREQEEQLARAGIALPAYLVTPL